MYRLLLRIICLSHSFHIVSDKQDEPDQTGTIDISVFAFDLHLIPSPLSLLIGQLKDFSTQIKNYNSPVPFFSSHVKLPKNP